MTSGPLGYPTQTDWTRLTPEEIAHLESDQKEILHTHEVNTETATHLTTLCGLKLPLGQTLIVTGSLPVRRCLTCGMKRSKY